jgi:high-affinity nickel-transport protein
MAPGRWTRGLAPEEWRRLGWFAAAIVLLHVVGWTLFLEYAHRYPPLAGAGLTAYLFGLRHAFDADHIAAIDNTTRKLLTQGRRPMGIGFFFSLGHASVVFGLVAALALATRAADTHVPAFQHYGGYVSAGVSGTFLWIIGILNLVVLLDVVRIFREMRGATTTASGSRTACSSGG